MWLQRKMKVSCMCLSADHSSFYVGYTFSGIVDKYTVDAGMLVCSAAAHYGDVHTLAVVQPGVVFTSGSDGHLRLLDMRSNDWTSPEALSTPTPSVLFSPDELAYHQMSTGVLSLRRARLQSSTSSVGCCLLVCLSTLPAPLLVNIRDVFQVQSLNLPSLTDFGMDNSCPVTLLIYLMRLVCIKI